jgi:hypothetical protein
MRLSVSGVSGRTNVTVGAFEGEAMETECSRVSDDGVYPKRDVIALLVEVEEGNRLRMRSESRGELDGSFDVLRENREQFAEFGEEDGDDEGEGEGGEERRGARVRMTIAWLACLGACWQSL